MRSMYFHQVRDQSVPYLKFGLHVVFNDFVNKFFNNFRCEELRNCATCKIHKTGQYNQEDCNKMCNYTIIGVNKLSGDNDLIIKKCRVPDNDTCIIMFEYFYSNKEIIVRVLKERICPEPVNVLGKKLNQFICIEEKKTEIYAPSKN